MWGKGTLMGRGNQKQTWKDRGEKWRERKRGIGSERETSKTPDKWLDNEM